MVREIGEWIVKGSMPLEGRKRPMIGREVVFFQAGETLIGVASHALGGECKSKDMADYKMTIYIHNLGHLGGKEIQGLRTIP